MVTTASSSDFKTIKAKVGKRAPVKANVTDTSFKSTGLHISKQVGISNTNNDSTTNTSSSSSVPFATTRSGLSLHQVLMQFKHPTIAVRISALKSFKNMLIEDSSSNDVCEKQQTNTILQSYVSDIISSLLPICCIDDEINVRKLAIQIFYDVFVSDVHHTSSSLQPFASYIIAMISTGLNSLNIQQQFDNAIMVRYFIEIISMDRVLHTRNITTINHAIMQFTPPLTRLLGVVPNTTTTTTGTTTTAATTTTTVTADAPLNQNKSFDTAIGTPATTTTTTTTTTTSHWVHGNGISHRNSPPLQQQQHPMMLVGSMKKSKNNQTKKRKRQKLSSSEQNKSSGSIHTTNTNTVKSSKVEGNIHTNPKFIVLMSIYTLYRNCNDFGPLGTSQTTTFGNAPMTESGTSLQPDVTIIPRQVRRTSIVLTGKKIDSQISSSISLAGIERTTTSSLSPNETLDLLVKVRDFMIETSQCSDSHSLLYCIMTVQFILEYYNCNNTWNNDVSIEDESITIVNQRCCKLCNQIGSCIMESFRMYRGDKSNNTTNDNFAVLSRTLLSITNTILPLIKTTMKINTKQEKEISNNIKIWIQLISMHIQSTLEDDEANFLMMATEQQDMETELDITSAIAPINEEMTTTKEMLSILSELLVRDDLRPYVTLRTRLIELFGAVFFLNHDMDGTDGSNHNHPKSSILICSEVGRTAIMLCCRLISMQQYDIERITQFFGINNTPKLLRSISYYMIHFKATYLTESKVCLSTLRHLILRMDRPGNDSSIAKNGYADLIPSLRVHLQSLLTVPPESNCDRSCSTFEMYPESFQRQFVCFCILSNMCSTTPIVKLYANICARCHHSNQKSIVGQSPTVVSTTMASFIVQSIFYIRKAMPMTVYLGFLIDSTGVMTLVEPTTASNKAKECVTMVRALDQGLRSILSGLIGCGTKKVLPMLEPVFTVLIGNILHDQTSIVAMIQARAVLCLLSTFGIDLHTSNVMDDGRQSIFHFLSSEFKELVVGCIMSLMSTGATQYFEFAVSVLPMNRWLSPIVSTFATEKSLFSRVLRESLLKLQECDSSAQKCITEMWLYILKEKRVTSMLQLEGDVVLADVLNHAKFTDCNEPTTSTKRLLTELEIRCSGTSHIK